MKRHLIFLNILLFILCTSIVIGIYIFSRQTSGNIQGIFTGKSIPTPADDISRLARHMVLPSETPKVIPLTNVETMKKDQPFFAKAKPSDQLYIFSEKVIIFDPVADKIVEFAHIRGASPGAFRSDL